MRSLPRKTSIWAIRFGPGYLMALSTVVMVLVAGAIWRGVRGEARWLISWDAGVLVYLALSWAVVVLLDSTRTRRRVLRKTPAGLAIFWVVLIAACTSAAAGVMMIHQPPYNSALSRGWHVGLALATVACAWMVLHTDFGFRYAARYYRNGRNGDHGLRFRAHSPPDYLDFMLFAFFVGMTSSVSDVEIRSRDMRWMTMLHGIISFIFNLLILSICINLIAGSLEVFGTV
ncbi:MAG: DUF1345 domain-containing protein [Candidatus Competibacter sp.]